jgi:hypothetical protein
MKSKNDEDKEELLLVIVIIKKIVRENKIKIPAKLSIF